VLDQHLLKAASSADQRHAPFTSRPYHGVHGLGVAVRAPGPNHHRRSRSRYDVDVINRLGWNDSNFDWTAGVLGSVAEGSDGSGVVALVRR
jgi:hypothetical protein